MLAPVVVARCDGWREELRTVDSNLNDVNVRWGLKLNFWACQVDRFLFGLVEASPS